MACSEWFLAISPRWQLKKPCCYMTKALAEPGRYASQEPVGTRHRILALVLAAIGAMCMVMGFMLGLSAHSLSLPAGLCIVVLVFAFLVGLGIGKWSFPRLDEPEKEGLSWQKGATGEVSAAHELPRPPDDSTARIGSKVRPRVSAIIGRDESKARPFPVGRSSKLSHAPRR